MIARIPQREAHDCQVAVCAMVLGITYEAARAQYPADLGKGITELHLDNVLVENGWAVARKYHGNCASGRKRDPWPPEPWGDLHVAHVENRAGVHAVLMMGDGTVIDPAREAPQRLADYGRVWWVAAVLPMRP